MCRALQCRPPPGRAPPETASPLRRCWCRIYRHRAAGIIAQPRQRRLRQPHVPLRLPCASSSGSVTAVPLASAAGAAGADACASRQRSSKGNVPPGHPVAFTSLWRCTVEIPYFCLRYATSSMPACFCAPAPPGRSCPQSRYRCCRSCCSPRVRPPCPPPVCPDRRARPSGQKVVSDPCSSRWPGATGGLLGVHVTAAAWCRMMRRVALRCASVPAHLYAFDDLHCSSLPCFFPPCSSAAPAAWRKHRHRPAQRRHVLQNGDQLVNDEPNDHHGGQQEPNSTSIPRLGQPVADEPVGHARPRRPPPGSPPSSQCPLRRCVSTAPLVLQAFAMPVT